MSAHKTRLSQLSRGSEPTTDYAIFETQLSIQRKYIQATKTRSDQRQKFMDLADALDGFEALILPKIKLGLVEWGIYYDKIQAALRDPNLPYYDLQRYKKIIKLRYSLMNIVLQSLGYATTSIVKKEYDSVMKEEPDNTNVGGDIDAL